MGAGWRVQVPQQLEHENPALQGPRLQLSNGKKLKPHLPNFVFGVSLLPLLHVLGPGGKFGRPRNINLVSGNPFKTTSSTPCSSGLALGRE